jgi:hypothetical protein
MQGYGLAIGWWGIAWFLTFVLFGVWGFLFWGWCLRFAATFAMWGFYGLGKFMVWRSLRLLGRFLVNYGCCLQKCLWAIAVQGVQAPP